MKKILLMILFSLFVISFVSAEGTSSGSGGGGGEGAKIYHIDDTFKVGWTDGTDNYEAEYKVWKIEEQSGQNITILVHASTGSIAIHSLNGLTTSLGASSKLIINQIYVSGDDRWISISLQNAQFKESTTAPTSPSSGGGGGGGTTNNTGGGGAFFGIALQDLLQKKPEALPETLTDKLLEKIPEDKQADFVNRLSGYFGNVERVETTHKDINTGPFLRILDFLFFQRQYSEIIK